MKDRQVPIAIEKLVAMVVIAFGESICECFMYTPKLPLVFTENINVNGKSVNFKSISVFPNGMLLFWFEKEDGYYGTLTIEDVKRHCPYLLVSIITHVFDMIENVKDC